MRFRSPTECRRTRPSGPDRREATPRTVVPAPPRDRWGPSRTRASTRYGRRAHRARGRQRRDEARARPPSRHRLADDRWTLLIIAVGPAEQVHDMDHGDVLSGALQAHAHLKDAARVGGPDNLRARIDAVR